MIGWWWSPAGIPCIPLQLPARSWTYPDLSTSWRWLVAGANEKPSIPLVVPPEKKEVVLPAMKTLMLVVFNSEQRFCTTRIHMLLSLRLEDHPIETGNWKFGAREPVPNSWCSHLPRARKIWTGPSSRSASRAWDHWWVCGEVVICWARISDHFKPVRPCFFCVQCFVSIIVANQQIRTADFDPSFASVKQKGAPMRNAQRKDVLYKEHEVTRAAGRRQVPLQAVQVVDWVYIPTFIFRIYLDKLQYFTHLKSSAILGCFPAI